jgi:signal-transduction protein with cAMP-binding, CBS, and nucleotidyltransferase domain
MGARTEIFRRRIHGHVGAVVTALPGRPVGEVIREMAGARASSAIVVDQDKKPVGILTERDIVQRIVWQVTAETPISAVMSAPVHAIEADRYLFQAVALMRKLGYRNIPVVGARGKLRGVLSLQDALGFLSPETMDQIESISQDSSEEGLRRVKEAQIDLAEELFADNVPAPEVQSVLSDLNADIHRRVAGLAVAQLAGEGQGEPPYPFALMIFGSGGRGENFLSPDQDNGFVIADHDESGKEISDAYFTALAARINAMLDRIGFPLCKGNVMASNVIWRRTLTGWRKELRRWVQVRKEDMLLNSAIFADVRSAYGERGLVRFLKDEFIAEGARSNQFQRDLFMSSADHSVALGWFGRLRIERDASDRSGMINLKLRGTLPLVEAVRVQAIKAGVTQTGTLDRLDALRAAGRMTAQDHDYLANGFEFITGLLLRQQIADRRQGREPSDFIAEAGLSKREKDQLVTYFRAIANLRDTVRSDFGGGTL